MVDDNDNRDYGEKQEHDISSSVIELQIIMLMDRNIVKYVSSLQNGMD
jgi:hypothetical protein